MKSAKQSKTLMAHEANRKSDMKAMSKQPMVDGAKRAKSPPPGVDADPTKVIAGRTTPTLRDRDGPARRGASDNPQAKKPATTEKQKITMIDSPMAKQPGMSMPSPAMMARMKSKVKASAGSFKR